MLFRSLSLSAGAIVLSMGCRERTRGAIKIPGSRPSGVLTAGLAQRYVNLENAKPGERIVILGSGDIGLIMARRLSLEGMTVLGVYELMPYANGLYRNIKNCLDDFDIPLHLSTTVTNIIGHPHLEAIEVTKVDENFELIQGTEQIIACDTLLLSIGLIPENELSQKADVILNPVTNGPFVNEKLETTTPGIFACGNVLHVHDLVDNVSLESEEAGTNAADYALKDKDKMMIKNPLTIEVKAGKNITYTVPSQFVAGGNFEKMINFRVKKPLNNAQLVIKSNKEIIYQGKIKAFKPSVMEEIKIKDQVLKDYAKEITLAIEEVKR